VKRTLRANPPKSPPYSSTKCLPLHTFSWCSCSRIMIIAQEHGSNSVSNLVVGCGGGGVLQSPQAMKRSQSGNGCCQMDSCYRLADELVSGQRKVLVVVAIIVVTVLGAVCGLLLGFTLLQHIPRHPDTALIDTHQLGSLAAVVTDSAVYSGRQASLKLQIRMFCLGHLRRHIN